LKTVNCEKTFGGRGALSDASSLTVAKLKALCVLHDQPTSGRKADLVARLLEAGLDRSTVGLSEPREAEQADEEVISLELEPEPVRAPEVPVPKLDDVPLPAAEEEEVLEAEVLDAIPIEDDAPEEDTPPEVVPPVVPLPGSKSTGPTTLFDMVKTPKAAAVVLVLLLLGAGGWYWAGQQLNPVTVDALRYGDRMGFVLVDGQLTATEGFVEPVIDQLDIEDDICRLEVSFSGDGDVSVHQGTLLDIPSQGSDDRLLGTVSVRGAHGMEWLAVQQEATYDLDELVVKRHLRSIVPGSSECSSSSASASGSADLTLTSWTEIGDRVNLRSNAAWEVDLEGVVRGSTTTYGVGGLLGSFEVFAPGIAMLTQPVELQALVGSTPIEKGATGSGLGWDWSVIGAEDFAGKRMWRIVATQPDLTTYCLGSATLSMWVEADNPWASRQTVDVRLSSENTGQQDCSTLSQQLGDAVLPDGEFRLTHTFERTSISRGEDRLDLGTTYVGRPSPNELGAPEDALVDWTRNATHVPDGATAASTTVEDAVACLRSVGSSASGANGALDNEGYIWRAVGDSDGSVDAWNLSWVGNDDAHGWVRVDVGPGDDGSCTFVAKESLDLGIVWNRESAPAVVSMSEVEGMLVAEGRFPELMGNKGLFDDDGSYNEGLRRGVLVAVPDDGLTGLISELVDGDAGATTYDYVRTWEAQGWDSSLSVAVDATSGRLLATSLIERPA
jgi:hypothetical protein